MYCDADTVRFLLLSLALSEVIFAAYFCRASRFFWMLAAVSEIVTAPVGFLRSIVSAVAAVTPVVCAEKPPSPEPERDPMVDITP